MRDAEERAFVTNMSEAGMEGFFLPGFPGQAGESAFGNAEWEAFFRSLAVARGIRTNLPIWSFMFPTGGNG